MRTTEEKINSDVKKALQTSFSDFEGDFGDAFDKNILRSLRKPLWRRPLVAWSVMGIITSLTLGILLVLHTVERNKNVVKAKSTFSNIANEKGSLISVTGEKKPASIAQESITTKRRSKRKAETQYRTEIITENMKPMAGVQSKSPIRKSVAQDESLPARKIITIENRNLTRWSGLKMPSIEFYNKEAQVPPVISNKSHKFIISFTPTQVSYGLYLKPGVDMRIQDVSLKNSFMSVGMKVSAGIEIHGTQFLLNYSHLNNKIVYAIATEKFATQEIHPGEYLVKRLGDNKELQIPRHWLGIGIKKQLNLQYFHRNDLVATIGGDFSRALQRASTNQIQANFMVGKSFSPSPSTLMTLGPYFEYGINKQTFLNGQLQARQYQYGISLGLKLVK